jgi:hypothetical protein
LALSVAPCRCLALCGGFFGKRAIGRQLVSRRRHPATVDDDERHSAPSRDTTCSGKVEFCLTKLQAPRANSWPFAAPRLIDVLNAFGLFAHARRDLSSTIVGCCL